MASGLRRNFGTMIQAAAHRHRGAQRAHRVRLATCASTAAPDIFEAKSGVYSTLGVEESSADVTATPSDTHS
jgi:hypothetical protein